MTAYALFDNNEVTDPAAARGWFDVLDHQELKAQRQSGSKANVTLFGTGPSGPVQA
ncbi:hypothetical protein [Streptomyces sp. NPDC001568]|uniref:hypothetical protein n=1 Tax=Streptomyces sp. NPDC001568 TaxID=3364588 RepID=UPI0036782A83